MVSSLGERDNAIVDDCSVVVHQQLDISKRKKFLCWGQEAGSDKLCWLYSDL
jgi:hypothetical protein